MSGLETCRQRLLSVSKLPGVNPEGSAEERLLQVSSLLPLESANLVSPPPLPGPARNADHTLSAVGSQCGCSVEVRGEEEAGCGAGG